MASTGIRHGGGETRGGVLLQPLRIKAHSRNSFAGETRGELDIARGLFGWVGAKVIEVGVDFGDGRGELDADGLVDGDGVLEASCIRGSGLEILT